MDGYRPEGDWKQRITALALRLREAFGEQLQLAAVWGRYGSGGTGSRLVMEVLLQALRARPAFPTRPRSPDVPDHACHVDGARHCRRRPVAGGRV
ncbi:hypothetical protein H340_13806 [Streptomyces mobaraensis NBRC 13819 = DSM 40847]|uniref:Uncharacterized protein n=1 Tax=Streptomyces mobaraensis (strain ATCC 29032 / DSM 40847 / JCM 4168 / NBRC 13819 / NCIMB 11159 / IPCR 16-22) TaxID=1223523 RepID=M3C7M5_STRM1|nr:hypothetical protein H340_13806 [Streptomyces mobaraensis NBRC 13819 = DSM 40847]